MLVAVLLGNIIACGVCACAMTYAQPDIIAPDMAIVGSRLAKGPLACFLLAIGCGFIMTTAVQFGREGKFLPLLFGVPVFILCGFTHSVADAFYFLAVHFKVKYFTLEIVESKTTFFRVKHKRMEYVVTSRVLRKVCQEHDLRLFPRRGVAQILSR